MSRIKSLGFILILWMLLLTTAFANQESWPDWVATLRQEAIDQGIHPALFDEVFQDLKPNPKVLHFDRKQPEHRLTLEQYRKTRADLFKIKLGRHEFKRHEAILKEVAAHFNVSPCFIVALWGMESSYGRYMGNFPVIQSLATLAYDHRRGDYFRNELLIALHILDEGHVSLENFKGEWAGASGHPQFLPSSWMKYAVDYNGDGHKDIWNNYPDVFASIANYLHVNGWQLGEPWATQINLPADFSDKLIDKGIVKTVGEWQKLGITALPGFELADPTMNASVILPLGGPAYLIYNNFKTLMTYNNSIYYAATVGYMADEICNKT